MRRACKPAFRKNGCGLYVCFKKDSSEGGIEMINIIHKIPRCSDEIIEEYRRQASATVHEAMGKRGALDPAIKPLARGMKAVGRAITVKCHPGDNVMLVKAISMAKENDVIVVNMA